MICNYTASLPATARGVKPTAALTAARVECCSKLRRSKVMKSLLARQTTALLLCLLLCGPMPLGAQSSSPGQSAGAVGVRPHRARAATERGGRAETDGRVGGGLRA